MNQPTSAFESGAARADDALIAEVAQQVVEALNLEVAPAAIGADDPLDGDGLGLDSIDMLELALVVSKRYGLQLRAENEETQQIFTSLRTLADHIAQHRTA